MLPARIDHAETGDEIDDPVSVVILDAAILCRLEEDRRADVGDCLLRVTAHEIAGMHAGPPHRSGAKS
jgi:hypothetical protein